MARPLYEIAREIQKDPAYKSAAWCAGPYVSAMGSLSTMADRYYEDDARSVVLYALSNLQSWRGAKAREIKAELKGMLNVH